MTQRLAMYGEKFTEAAKPGYKPEIIDGNWKLHSFNNTPLELKLI